LRRDLLVAPDRAHCGKLRNDHVSALLHYLHVHLVASAPNARHLECFPDDQVLNFRKLINRQLEVENGELLLPQTPGLGFEFDEEAVAKYALNRTQTWTEIK